MLQLHKVLIGLILVGMTVVGVMGFVSSGIEEYAPADYNPDKFDSFNKLEDLSNDINNFRQQESNTTVNKLSESIGLDIIGDFFTNMYQAAKVFRGSTDLMYDMVDESVDTLPVGNYKNVLKTGFSLMIIVIVFVGIFLHFVTKSERT